VIGATEVLARLDADDLVLDVGGWADPFARADWVIDLMPYETRGLYGAAAPDERFTADTWVVRDMCDREPWPFADKQFDFAVCSHTLEDVRDPVWVCSELQRVARAGYIEVPSRLEEQSFGVQGPWVGWSHHRWLIDVDNRAISFAHKSQLLDHRAADRFPTGFHAALGPDQRVSALWWEDGFDAEERFFNDPSEYDDYLRSFVAAHRPRRLPFAPWAREHRRLARERWNLRRRMDFHRRWRR
jgi:SAM-dependent methyltransferase